MNRRKNDDCSEIIIENSVHTDSCYPYIDSVGTVLPVSDDGMDVPSVGVDYLCYWGIELGTRIGNKYGMLKNDYDSFYHLFVLIWSRVVLKSYRNDSNCNKKDWIIPKVDDPQLDIYDILD